MRYTQSDYPKSRQAASHLDDIARVFDVVISRNFRTPDAHYGTVSQASPSGGAQVRRRRFVIVAAD
jgi:hypothetical protein